MKTVTAYNAYTPHYLYSLFYRGQWLIDCFESELEELAKVKGYTRIKVMPVYNKPYYINLKA